MLISKYSPPNFKTRPISTFVSRISFAILALIAIQAEAAALAKHAEIASYKVIITVTPDKITAFTGRERELYEQCKATAQELKLPVKPFTELPNDFVVERQTMISDGQRYFEHSETHQYTSNMAPDNGCDTSIVTSSSTQIWRDKQTQQSKLNQYGIADIDEPEPYPETREIKPEELRAFTIRKAVAGQALRCLPNSHPMIKQRSVLFACVIDGGKLGTINDPQGSPVMVHMRVKSAESDPRFAHTLTFTPELIDMHPVIDPNQFDWVSQSK